ncbi:MAG: hypothetical protein Salg2KO_09560 [Salibacteraceae bacterium]
MIRAITIVIVLLSVCQSGRAQDRPFNPGEQLTYSVFYYLMGVWVGAGEVSFSVGEDTFMEKPCLKFTGKGQTHKRYDWFYKVRDTYEAYANEESLAPLRFKRDVSEGDFYFYEDCIFDWKNDQVFSVLQVKERPLRLDTTSLSEGTYDVLSMIYHARMIDYSKHEPGDKIPINMFIDREIHNLFIRYQGVEVYDHEVFGEIECYVFSPLLVGGTLFKPGERMNVYVTKDRNLIPIYIESEIRVGSIRATLKSTKGLVEPLVSR